MIVHHIEYKKECPYCGCKECGGIKFTNGCPKNQSIWTCPSCKKEYAVSVSIVSGGNPLSFTSYEVGKNNVIQIVRENTETGEKQEVTRLDGEII